MMPWDFRAQQSRLTQDGAQKPPVSGSSAGGGALLIKEVRGEPADLRFKMTQKSTGIIIQMTLFMTTVNRNASQGLEP